VAEVLAPDYDVVMVDARGHGKSAGPEQGYTSADHAADLAGVITGLGLQRPAVLGHSMGAATALVFAGTNPDLPRAILLEDPPPWWMPPPPAAAGSDTEWQNRVRRWIEMKRKTREELIAGERANSPAWSEAELGPWADSKLRLSFNVVLHRTAPSVIDESTVKRITCPVLLITADPEKGAIVSPEAAAALQGLLPQTRVAHIAGAGHSVRREQFARYMDTVKTFLAETLA
jgi:pimeloyl-ACP methyl ester carboxylesterase